LQVQEHRFNQPFQISSPHFMPGSVPADVRRYSLWVQPGDVILLGSDGLFDNLWEEDIAARVGARMQVRHPAGQPAASSRARASRGGGGGQAGIPAPPCSAARGPRPGLFGARLIAPPTPAPWQALPADSSTGEVEAAAAELASELAAAAHAHSRDPTYRSPFAVERHARGVAGLAGLLLGPMGGKQDDVTAVVSIVW
jgi:hypothetical protein